MDSVPARWRAPLGYLGHAQLARTDPDAVPAPGPARPADLDSVLGTLVTPRVPPRISLAGHWGEMNVR